MAGCTGLESSPTGELGPHDVASAGPVVGALGDGRAELKGNEVNGRAGVKWDRRSADSPDRAGERLGDADPELCRGVPRAALSSNSGPVVLPYDPDLGWVTLGLGQVPVHLGSSNCVTSL